MRPNLAPLEPNLLIPLANPEVHIRKRTQLERAAQRIAYRIVPDAAETPVHGNAGGFRDARGHGEGQVVQDDAGGVALVVGGGVHVRDEHGGALEGGVEDESGGRGDEVHGCGLDEVVFLGLVVAIITVAVVGVLGVAEVWGGERDGVFGQQVAEAGERGHGGVVRLQCDAGVEAGDVLREHFGADFAAFGAAVCEGVPERGGDEVGVVAGFDVHVVDESLAEDGAVDEDVDAEVGDVCGVVGRVGHVHVDLHGHRSWRGLDDGQITDREV